MKVGKQYLRTAMQSNDVSCLRSIHYYLNQVYYLKMFGEDKTRMIMEANIRKLYTVEKEWLANEETECRKRYDLMGSISLPSAIHALQHHAMGAHPLLDYFENFADKNDMKWFFLNEAVFNLEFFDYQALALIGASDASREHFIKQCWQHSGEANMHFFYSTLYKKLLTELKLTYNRDLIIANMPWQGIAQMNLLSYLAIYPYNKMKFYGFLMATQLMNIKLGKRLLTGVKRVFGTVDVQYYEEQTQWDAMNIEEWLDAVVTHEIYQDPHKAQDFWFGFYLRLQTLQQYYDYFSHTIGNSKAA